MKCTEKNVAFVSNDIYGNIKLNCWWFIWHYPNLNILLKFFFFDSLKIEYEPKQKRKFFHTYF